MRIGNRSSSRWFFVGFFTALLIAVLGGGTWYAFSIWKGMMEDGYSQNSLQTPVPPDMPEAMQALAQQEVDLLLKKIYVCGTEGEERIKKAVSSIDQLFWDYRDWELESQNGSTFVFKKHVHDLAPICKENGYFGLSKSGLLTLYEGPPQEEKVIQTFFQIDTKKLESRLPPNELELLKKGIRIMDMAEYNSILSTYGEFAAQDRDLPSKTE